MKIKFTRLIEHRGEVMNVVRMDPSPRAIPDPRNTTPPPVIPVAICYEHFERIFETQLHPGKSVTFEFKRAQ